MESLRPDHEKLLSVADAIAAMEIPNVSLAAESVRSDIADILDDCVVRIRQAANVLTRVGEAA